MSIKIISQREVILYINLLKDPVEITLNKRPDEYTPEQESLHREICLIADHQDKEVFYEQLQKLPCRIVTENGSFYEDLDAIVNGIYVKYKIPLVDFDKSANIHVAGAYEPLTYEGEADKENVDFIWKIRYFLSKYGMDEGLSLLKKVYYVEYDPVLQLYNITNSNPSK